MSLKKKLLLVVSVCIALLSLSGLISNIIITRAYARLLQETVANNLASSSSAISSSLNVIEDISTSLLADSLIQQNLILVNESTIPGNRLWLIRRFPALFPTIMTSANPFTWITSPSMVPSMLFTPIFYAISGLPPK